MKVAVIGKGAREHSIVHHLKTTNPTIEIHALAGNPGMENLAKLKSIPENHIQSIIQYIKEKHIQHVFVGPEVSLSLGLVDALDAIQIPCFGVKKTASQLESSKIFTKNLLKKYKIPTANFKIISSFEEGLEFIQKTSFPKVIKADGLASGKGVFIVHDVQSAETILNNLFIKKSLGNAADKVIIEDYLEGEEI